MDRLLTFSIAAYNVEQYLPQLFTTLLDARYIEMIEVLVINDGSSDRTAEVAEEYQKRFPTVVRLINKENGGHGSTINWGIQKARGKYFRALDGDDWVDANALCQLLDRIGHIDADIILSNYSKCYEDGRIVKTNFENLEDGRCYTFNEIAPLVQWMCYHTVIYKTEILQKHHIFLSEHCFYVDSEFMIFPIPYVSTVAFYAYNIYCYRLGIEGQSVSSVSRMKHYMDSLAVAKSLLNMYTSLPQISDEKRRYIEHGIAGHCTWHVKTILTFPPSHERKNQLLRFEQLVRKKSDKIYNEMEQFGKTSCLLRILRRTRYLFYRPCGLFVYQTSKK